MEHRILAMESKSFRATVIIFLSLIASCSKKQTSGEETANVSAVVPVRATAVVTGDVPEQLIVTGHTEAIARERLVCPIAGKLLTLNGTEGTFVKAGEIIATIQSKESQSIIEG